MNRSKSNRIYDLTTRLAAVGLVLVLVSMSGCVAAPVVAIYYMTTEKVVTVSMEVDAPASEVYRGLLEAARTKPPPGKIDPSFSELITDEENFFAEGKKVGGKGEEIWGALQVTPVSSRKSHVLYSAYGEEWPIEDIENRIRANLKEFCDMGYKCKLMSIKKEREAI